MSANLKQFSSNFAAILIKVSRNFTKYARKCKEFLNHTISDNSGVLTSGTPKILHTNVQLAAHKSSAAVILSFRGPRDEVILVILFVRLIIFG